MQIDIVIPCYRVSGQITCVAQQTLRLHQVRNIIVVDDGCPEQSGRVVRSHLTGESRVVVIEHETNQCGRGSALRLCPRFRRGRRHRRQV